MAVEVLGIGASVAVALVGMAASLFLVEHYNRGKATPIRPVRVGLGAFVGTTSFFTVHSVIAGNWLGVVVMGSFAIALLLLPLLVYKLETHDSRA